MNMRSLADHSFYNTSDTLRLIRVLTKIYVNN